jgi:predicted secreted hydrolase
MFQAEVQADILAYVLALVLAQVQAEVMQFQWHFFRILTREGKVSGWPKHGIV